MCGSEGPEAKVVSAERNAWTEPAAEQVADGVSGFVRERAEGGLVLYSATAPGDGAAERAGDTT
jgi:hypothetical protein